MVNIKKYIVFIFFLGFIPIHAFSQKKSIDSLNLILKTAKEDTNKVKSLNELANIFELDGDIKNAKHLYNKSLYLSEKLNYKKGIERNLFDIGGLLYDESSYNNAMDKYMKALHINQEIGDSLRISDCYNMIGDVYRKQAKYPKALEALLKALKIREGFKSQKRIASTNNNIGLVYLEIKNYSKALEYFEKALKTAKETNNKYTICRCYNRMAIVYNEQGNNAKAMEYYQQALKIATEVDDKTIMWIALGNIGSLYTDLNEYDKAIDVYQKSAKLAAELGNQEGVCNNYKSMGYLDLKRKNYKSALELFTKSEKIAIDLELNDDIMDVYSGLYKLNKATGEFKKALEYHEKFKDITDSIYNKDNTKQMSDLKTQFEVDKKENELKAKAAAHELIIIEEKKRQQFMTYSVIAILIIVLLFSWFLYSRFRLTQKQKHIIENQKEQVELQKELVEEKQKEILDSITYAKRLQEAILPSTEFINKYVPENFVLYKPKDIVAGDFYWAELIGDLFFIAAADCTGHGVPGAMVSVVCSNALNRSVKEFHLTDTGKILDKTRELVLETFEKSSSDVKDGMDISLLCIDKINKEIFWSGANNPLWYIKDDTMHQIKPNKQSIGQTENPTPFITHSIEYSEGTLFYLLTDGYADQFGGTKGKKFKYKPLCDFILANHTQELSKQVEILDNEFITWKGALEQVDDVCLLGIKLYYKLSNQARCLGILASRKDAVFKFMPTV